MQELGAEAAEGAAALGRGIDGPTRLGGGEAAWAAGGSEGGREGARAEVGRRGAVRATAAEAGREVV